MEPKLLVCALSFLGQIRRGFHRRMAPTTAALLCTSHGDVERLSWTLSALCLLGSGLLPDAIHANLGFDQFGEMSLHPERRQVLRPP